MKIQFCAISVLNALCSQAMGKVFTMEIIFNDFSSSHPSEAHLTLAFHTHHSIIGSPWHVAMLSWWNDWPCLPWQKSLLHSNMPMLQMPHTAGLTGTEKSIEESCSCLLWVSGELLSPYPYFLHPCPSLNSEIPQTQRALLSWPHMKPDSRWEQISSGTEILQRYLTVKGS